MPKQPPPSSSGAPFPRALACGHRARARGECMLTAPSSPPRLPASARTSCSGRRPPPPAATRHFCRAPRLGRRRSPRRAAVALLVLPLMLPSAAHSCCCARRYMSFLVPVPTRSLLPSVSGACLRPPLPTALAGGRRRRVRVVCSLCVCVYVWLPGPLPSGSRPCLIRL